MIRSIFEHLPKNRRFKQKYWKMGLTFHFCYFFWVLRCRGTIFFILEYETTNIEEYFSNFFFQNFYVLGTPGYPRLLPLGVKTPKMICFGSDFFPNRFFGLIQEDWHQDCPVTIKNSWDIAIQSSGGVPGGQNFKPP